MSRVWPQLPLWTPHGIHLGVTARQRWERPWMSHTIDLSSCFGPKDCAVQQQGAATRPTYV